MDAAERAIFDCEDLAANDIQGRNIGPLAAHVRGALLAAARSIARHPSPRIGIITGFFLAHAQPPNCETDGPPGAALLAAGLVATGIPCRIATDIHSMRIVRAAVAAAGVEDIVPVDVVDDAAADSHALSLAAVRRVWDSPENRLSHVVAIERCGPSVDGRPRDARGVDISTRNAPLERLFDGAWTTIGVGDLGNELGMGSLPHNLVADSVPNGEALWCVVPCDHPIVCGISNWGAAALLASVAMSWPRVDRRAAELLHPSFSKRLLDAVCEQGAVAADSHGGPPAPRPFVDGQPWSVLEGIHRRIYETCRTVLEGMAVDARSAPVAANTLKIGVDIDDSVTWATRFGLGLSLE